MRYVPRWPGAIQGHAINTVRKFYPRLANDHEFDDLLQEAYYIYARCRHRYFGDGFRKSEAYATRVDRPEWFMTLFSRALNNHMITLVKKSRTSYSVDADESVRRAVEERQEDGDLAAVFDLLSKLPSEVSELVRVALVGQEEEAQRAADLLLQLPRWAQQRVYRLLEETPVPKKTRGRRPCLTVHATFES